jgi:hypothetical protein
MNKLIAALVLSTVSVLAAAGCAVDPADDHAAAPAKAEKPTPAEEENISKTEAALISGGGGGGSNNFSCGALGCVCNGDYDCNNLFSSGACGSWPARCYERGPSSYCVCAPWVGITASGSTARTGVATSGTLSTF